MTPVKPDTHCGRVLAALTDGRWHTTRELYRTAGPMILHSRVADLRAKGYDVECEHVPGRGNGAAAYRYRWVDAPGKPYQLPRPSLKEKRIGEYDPQQRYRFYQPGEGREQTWVGWAGAKTLAGLGTMLATFLEEDEIDRTQPLGILDTGPWAEGEPGVWLALPYGSTGRIAEAV